MTRKDSLWRMIAVLGLTALLSGALLGFFYDLTADPIAKASARQLSESLAELMPPFSNDPLADAKRIAVEGDTLTLYPCIGEGSLVGAAIESVSHNGFGGDIRLLVCFSADGGCTGFRVMSHAETPGLGAKMGDWFGAEPRRAAILGRHEEPLSVKADGGQVDAITGATITCGQFLEAVSRASEAFNTYYNEQAEDRH